MFTYDWFKVIFLNKTFSIKDLCCTSASAMSQKVAEVKMLIFSLGWTRMDRIRRTEHV